MRKLNLIKFYRFGAELKAAHRPAGEPPVDTFIGLSGAIHWLTNFLIETHNVPMPNARSAATTLLTEMGAISGEAHKNMIGNSDPVVTSNVATRLHELLENFEREFEHDSREINVFSVPTICAYSTTVLINAGVNLLPDSVRQSVSDYARNEINEAGKCLAFGLPTAAGFHLLRGRESILRSYYDALSGGAPRPKTKSGNDVAMGGYIDQIQKWADPKVVETLRQITNLHRNPLNHPQDVLTDEDTVVLVGIVVSAATGMVNDAKAKGHVSLS